MRKLTHEEIVSRQAKKADAPKLPLCAVLNNIRSLHNVGTIFRTADGAGVEKIWLCGITGYPPQGGIAKTALGAENHVPWEYREDTLGLLKDLKNKGYQIVLLEQMQGSVCYDVFKTKSRVCLVVGNEVDGITEALQSLSDAAIEIEMDGIKNSLNVAVAFGIAVYQLRGQLKNRLLK
ncbi:MAG: RNA methyltransferase [Candidatus Omnitrophica bacterium]|nr:RNA methyltransferase [Candidatus Omnitrophota bacterium]